MLFVEDPGCNSNSLIESGESERGGCKALARPALFVALEAMKQPVEIKEHFRIRVNVEILLAPNVSSWALGGNMEAGSATTSFWPKLNEHVAARSPPAIHLPLHLWCELTAMQHLLRRAVDSK